jgi:hypothetical protein
LLPDRTTVRSPDELRVTVRAYDPDGMDSVWLKVDGREEGLDGLLRTSFEARLAMTIQSGHSPGTNVELRVRARDLSGFTDTLWDTVTVIP